MEGGRLKGGRLIEVLLYLLVTQASREHNWRQFPQVTLRLPHATFLASGHDSANSPQLVMRVSDRVDILWLLKDCVTTLSRVTQDTFLYSVKLRKWLKLLITVVALWRTVSQKQKCSFFFKTQDGVLSSFHPLRLKQWRYYPGSSSCASDC